MSLHVCVCVHTCTHAAGTYVWEQIFLIQWPLDNCTNDNKCEIIIGHCVASA